MSDAPNSDPRVALATKRTTLASFRTAQALDRTTLAWVRTTLTMGSFGFGLIGFFRTLEEHAHERPRPKALQPAQRLDRASHPVAPMQAMAQWRLETTAGNQAVRRVRVGEPDSVDTFDCISEA
jgi:hypothetical protein